MSPKPSTVPLQHYTDLMSLHAPFKILRVSANPSLCFKPRPIDAKLDWVCHNLFHKGSYESKTILEAGPRTRGSSTYPNKIFKSFRQEATCFHAKQRFRPGSLRHTLEPRTATPSVPLNNNRSAGSFLTRKICTANTTYAL